MKKYIKREENQCRTFASNSNNLSNKNGIIQQKRHPIQLKECEQIIGDNQAKNLWLSLKRPSFNVLSKYNADHVLDNLSKKTAKEASIERFKKDNMPNKNETSWHNMTWTESNETTIKNKAYSSNKNANLFSSSQQLTCELKNIKSRTVTPTKLTPSEIRANRIEKEEFTTNDKSKISVNFNVQDEEKKVIYGIGNWIPEKGKAEIYHYGAPVANDDMLLKYKTWIIDDESKDLIRPKVTPE